MGGVTGTHSIVASGKRDEGKGIREEARVRPEATNDPVKFCLGIKKLVHRKRRKHLGSCCRTDEDLTGEAIFIGLLPRSLLHIPQ